jgi:hypothetical protein
MGSHTVQGRIAAITLPVLVVVLSSCGGGSSGAAKVASLDSSGGASGAATSTTLSPKDQQDAILKYAACMRDNGVEMKDPTFDANGNMTGGGFGRDSGIDPRSTSFQTAQTKCGDLVKGIDFFGRRRGNFDPTKLQAAMTDFTACLRDHGQQVDDITFGGPGGGPGQNGAPGNSTPADGSRPAGGFGGPPPGGSPPNGNAPGGAGFDPTTRLIERLGLDTNDPAVKTAVDACKSIITDAFGQNSTTATTNG